MEEMRSKNEADQLRDGWWLEPDKLYPRGAGISVKSITWRQLREMVEFVTIGAKLLLKRKIPYKIEGPNPVIHGFGPLICLKVKSI